MLDLPGRVWPATGAVPPLPPGGVFLHLTPDANICSCAFPILALLSCVPVTAEGHALTRLHRLLDSGRGSADQIRLLVVEPQRRPDLELALAICLERQLDLVDAQLVLAALAALPGAAAKAGVDALIEISGRYGLRRVDDLLLAWIDRRGLAGE
jgi:hypothetical protein